MSEWLSQKLHSSWLIAGLSLGFIVGVSASLLVGPVGGLLWIVTAVICIVAGFRRARAIGIILVLIGGILVGVWRGNLEKQATNTYKQYFGETVVMTGKVSEDPSIAVDGSMRLKLKEITIDESGFQGEVWATLRDQENIKRSDMVQLKGQISEGFGTIPAALYKATLLSVVRQDYADVARDVRDDFAKGIRQGIREPEASLGAGFLVGQRSTLPEKLDQELRLLGLTHIVVASGYNLTILIRFARRLLNRISRYVALSGSITLVYGFSLVTGFSPSMSRASLIAILSLLAWYYGRKFHPVVLLSFSAAVTIIINPSYAWGDIGWLLSFTSFIGVIVMAPLLQAYFWGEKQPSAIRQVFVETLSAQVLTLPIVAIVFSQYSPLALPANVLILPVIPLTMLLTFIAGMFGVITPVLAPIVGFPAELTMRYMTTVVDRLARFPQADTEVTYTATTVVLSYIAICMLIIFLRRRSGYKLRSFNVVE